ncbi:DUF3825 domain-containing protein [Streptomyces sp. NBC_00117]|uniref:DUF6221 family protein n=1 Tax=unclassified Streptomyces TaxID=2593676 RepID=UPI00324B59B1
MDDLVQWLGEQLDEDERIAWAAGGNVWRRQEYPSDAVAIYASNGEGVVYDEGWPSEGQAEHIVEHDPARVLREIDAKRQVVSLYAEAVEAHAALRARMREVVDSDPDGFWRLHRQESELIETESRIRPVVRLVALPYADRPGYREEWRP